jgi:Ca2+-binding EF-hand superfamily protein
MLTCWLHFLDAEFAFGIYDCDGSGKVDAYDIPDVLRSLNLNPTLELCEKMGATKKRGEKKLSVEEFLPIFGQVSCIFQSHDLNDSHITIFCS